MFVLREGQSVNDPVPDQISNLLEKVRNIVNVIDSISNTIQSEQEETKRQTCQMFRGTSHRASACHLESSAS